MLDIEKFKFSLCFVKYIERFGLSILKIEAHLGAGRHSGKTRNLSASIQINIQNT